MTSNHQTFVLHRRVLILALALLMLAGWQPQQTVFGANQAVPNPILLVTSASAANPFNNYLSEILHAEGISTFDAVAVGDLTAASFTGRKLVILPEAVLAADRATLIANYVNAGGNIVAMRPDDQVAGLFGLQTKAGAIDSAYLAIDPNVTLVDDAPGLGLPTTPLQFHGPANLYALQAGTQAIAQFHSAPGTPNGYAAVTRIISGGARVAFNYDLARSVVLTRQGNPAWATPAGFTADLFRPQTGTTWVDLNVMGIPQADEQQRLFANIVLDLADADFPVPQLWYFPNAAKSVVIPTVNTISNPLLFLTPIMSATKAVGGQATFFIGIGGLDKNDIAAMRADGHDVGVLPVSNRPDPINPVCCQITNLEEGFNKQTQWFNQNMQSPPSKGVRAESYQWSGWTTAAQYAANNGYGMEYSHATLGAWLKGSNGVWARGYVSGSGRPMKFADPNGAVLPVYQQPTVLVDAQLLFDASAAGEQLSTQESIAVARDRINASINGDYAAVVLGMTELNTTPSSLNWLAGVVQYAVSQTLPVLTAGQWWDFNQARDTTTVSDMNWNGATGKLTYNTTVSASNNVSITTVLPVLYGGRSLRSVRIDGNAAPFTISNVKLTNRAFVVMPNGAHQVEATYEPDAPIGNLTAGTQSSAPHFLYREVTFAASVDAGTGVSYLWDFGDGFFGSGPNPRHAYTRWGANNGRYVVTVTATNSLGKRTTSFPIQLTLPAGSFLPIIVR